MVDCGRLTAISNLEVDLNESTAHCVNHTNPLMMKHLMLCILIASTTAFSPPIQAISRQVFARYSPAARITTSKITPVSTSSLKSFPDAQSTIFIAETQETWRQYVPLFVTSCVILDIVLGSPIANAALGPMRRAAGDLDDKEKAPGFTRNPNERVDTDSLAQEAVQRARYSMDLRQFLDENKTDEQRYAEVRKKIDQQAEELEDNLEKFVDKK